jgi:hypothetical protein
MDPPFLTSALDGGEWSASRPGRFTPEERAPDTHWLGHQVGPKSRSGNWGKKKLTLQGIEPQYPGCPTRSVATILSYPSSLPIIFSLPLAI